MKQLSQFIALNLLGLNALNIIAAIGSGIILLQVFVNAIAENKKSWEMSKKNSELENNMWAIE